MVQRRDPIPEEPHSWREYRLKLLDMVEKHELEIARLHDAHIEMQVLTKARAAGWGWVGAVAGSIIGSMMTALIIKLLHL